jgi:hypothetical protein
MSSSVKGQQHQDNSVIQSESTSDMDFLSQLAQKDQDLILAAELGKALLERNEELTRANEKITEEYSAKLEVRHFTIFMQCFFHYRHSLYLSI